MVVEKDDAPTSRQPQQDPVRGSRVDKRAQAAAAAQDANDRAAVTSKEDVKGHTEALRARSPFFRIMAAQQAAARAAK